MLRNWYAEIFCCLPSSVHQSWSSTSWWPCGYFSCVSLEKVGLKKQVHPQQTVRLLKTEFQVSNHGANGLCSSTCWTKQTLTTDCQWAYYCTCHIFLILWELYAAMLRIVQLAFSIKPCPLSQIRLTTQTGLYNRWIVECAVDGYTVLLCRQLQAWICRPDHHQNSW